jgi:hypothetical protein
MMIGLLPALDTGDDASAASTAIRGPQRRPVTTSPTLLVEMDGTEPAIYGGSHVDIDH